MSKWIAEFELEDGDTMPEHMDLNYMGTKIDFHCRPKEPILDKIRAEIMQVANEEKFHDAKWALGLRYAVNIIDKYKTESEG